MPNETKKTLSVLPSKSPLVEASRWSLTATASWSVSRTTAPMARPLQVAARLPWAGALPSARSYGSVQLHQALANDPRRNRASQFLTTI